MADILPAEVYAVAEEGAWAYLEARLRHRPLRARRIAKEAARQLIEDHGLTADQADRAIQTAVNRVKLEVERGT